MAIEKIQVNNATYNLSSTYFDGQWVISPYQILSGTALGSASVHTYSLSSYLPSDSSSYNYEISISGSCVTTSTKGKVACIYLYPGTKTYSELGNVGYGIRLARAVCRTAATQKGGGSAIIPISSSDRNVTVCTAGASANSTIYLWVTAYRKLGVNT